MQALAHSHARVKAALYDVNKAFIVRQFQLDVRVLQQESGEHGLQDHRRRDPCCVQAQRARRSPLKDIQLFPRFDDLPKGWTNSREIQLACFRQAHASRCPMKQ